MLSALNPLRNVTHLRVVLGCKVYAALDPPWCTAYSEPFVRAVRAPSFDFDGTVAALASGLPALQYVFLTTCGSLATRDEVAQPWRVDERWNASRAWRVADVEPATGSTNGAQDVTVGGPSRRLVELHKDVAETIIWNEELLLSEADEVRFFVLSSL